MTAPSTPHIIYLDNNATTACAPEVIAEMMPYFAEHYGNASSVHLAGRKAFRAVEEARERVASLLAVRPHELFFNSGATEGNNWIFQAFAESAPVERKRIVVSSIEHKSVLEPALRLRTMGFDVHLLPVTTDGVVDLKRAGEIITSETLLVSVQFANNETGVIQPIAELTALTHRAGAFFHCDAVQGLGKEKLDLSELPVDSAVFSAHKVHGPKGVGALFIRGGAKNWRHALPLTGGGQERSIRPGTLNVPGIVGFGMAAKLLYNNVDKNILLMQSLREYMEKELLINIKNIVIHGKNSKRISNTSYILIKNINSDLLISNLSLYCLSLGSACNNNSISGSYVLKNMNINDNLNIDSIRISISRYNTKYEIDQFLKSIYESIDKIKSINEVL